jgi:hypothetical protein
VPLKKSLHRFNRRIGVVPNGWDDRMQLSRGEERLPYRRVMWRGGDSHNEDLAVFANQFVRAANEGPEAIFTFVGASVYQIHDRMPTACMEEIPFRDVMTYFQVLGEFRPSILMVPLNDTHFNRCKSNISLMEGAFAGAAVLAPDWDDWHAPGVTHYTDVHDFGTKLIQLMYKTDAELKDLSDQTWLAVRSNLLVSRANKLRAMFFTKLIEEAYKTKRTLGVKTEPDKLDEISVMVSAQPQPETQVQ